MRCVNSQNWVEEAGRWTPKICSKSGGPYLQVAYRSVADREHEENRARDSEDAADHLESKTCLAVKQKSARAEDT